VAVVVVVVVVVVVMGILYLIDFWVLFITISSCSRM